MATQHATKAILGEKHTDDNRDKPRLVSIFTVPYPLESSIADINVCSHDCLDSGARVTIILELINSQQKDE